MKLFGWLRKLFPNIWRRPQSPQISTNLSEEDASDPDTDVEQETCLFDWHVIAESVRGATHLRRNLPNQDAVQSYTHDGKRPFIVLAVADGHGSAKCFRSDRGAQMAVSVGVNQVREFLIDHAQVTDMTSFKRAVYERLPREIAQTWKETVEHDLTEHPLLASETAQVAEEQGYAAREAVEKHPIVAYGSTLLIVVAHPLFIAGLQLGDGDMLRVDAGGNVEPMMEQDDRLLANETTSLSADHAWRDFRCCFWPIVDRPPALILAATDGYSNSFSTEAGFFKVGSDLLELFHTDGREYVQNNLPDWLATASRQGSGDDVTAGMLYCPSATANSAPLEAAAEMLDGRGAATTGNVDSHATLDLGDGQTPALPPRNQ